MMLWSDKTSGQVVCIVKISNGSLDKIGLSLQTLEIVINKPFEDHLSI